MKKKTAKQVIVYLRKKGISDTAIQILIHTEDSFMWRQVGGV